MVISLKSEARGLYCNLLQILYLKNLSRHSDNRTAMEEDVKYKIQQLLNVSTVSLSITTWFQCSFDSVKVSQFKVDVDHSSRRLFVTSRMRKSGASTILSALLNRSLQP